MTSNEPDLDALARSQALFAGLIYSEDGEPVQMTYVGDTAHYVVPDQGFMRHVAAYRVDRVVIEMIQGQMEGVQDEVVKQMLDLLGTDDLFTKAAINASMRNLEQSIRQGDVSSWQPMLGMMGFRIIVDLHGRVVDVVFPQSATDGE